MTFLLIDNSNTRTKFCLANEKELLGNHEWIATSDISEITLKKIINLFHFDATLLCSVVPEKAEIISFTLEKYGRFHQISHTSNHGITIDYPNPQQIGADRLANAVGVMNEHTAPAIVIDFGTAVTFDVISAENAYCGGVIAPGLGAMNDYLHRKTALLPLIELSEPIHAIGKSTDEAMRAGAVYGYRGLIKEIISQLIQEIDGDVKIIATGGDAELITKGLSMIHCVDPDITLQGIRHIAVRTFCSS
jgi:type III pantothenate kinase